MTTAPTATTAPGPGADELSLRCLEIFGGNEATNRRVRAGHLDIWVLAEPYEAGHGGGDIHFISQCAAGAVARIAIADVSGHGEAVSGIASRLRKLVRKNISRPDQSRLVRSLNTAFGAEGGSSGHFATGFFASFDVATGSLVWVNAGHPPPLIRGADGSWRALDTEHGSVITETTGAPETAGMPPNLPLGIIEPTAYSQAALPFRAGETIVLYTDALPEASDANGRMLGSEGLLRLVEGIDTDDPEMIGKMLVDRVRAYASGPIDDDLTVLAITRRAEAGPGMSAAEKLGVVGRMLGVLSDRVDR